MLMCLHTNTLVMAPSYTVLGAFVNMNRKQTRSWIIGGFPLNYLCSNRSRSNIFFYIIFSTAILMPTTIFENYKPYYKHLYFTFLHLLRVKTRHS